MSLEYPSSRSLTSQFSTEETTLTVRLDLVSAARRHLKFLRYVSVYLPDYYCSAHHPLPLSYSIRRYEELWMPLMADLTDEKKPHPPMILPPVDVEWVWYCHSLNPIWYREYCLKRFSKLIGKATIFDEENEEYAVKRCKEVWTKRYPNEAFENQGDSPCMGGVNSTISENEHRLARQVENQKHIYDKFMGEAYMEEVVYLVGAKRRYNKMLQMVFQRGASVDNLRHHHCILLVPTVDILLMWLTHQSYPTVYAEDTKHIEDEQLMKVVGPWDHSVKEEDIQVTKKLWESTFDQPYEKAGARIAVDFNGGDVDRPLNPVSFVGSDTDVNNANYKSLHPRYLLEICVFVQLRSPAEATHSEKTREVLRLQMLRCHRELKLEKSISKFNSNSWTKAWHLYCEFETKGITFELRHPGNLCFIGNDLLDSVSVKWNDLLRAPSLAIEREVDHKARIFTSITPPVQAPYLLKCVPDRVTDDSGAMISDVMLKLNQYRPQEGRWLSRTVLDHAGKECFVVRMRVGGGFWRRGGETPETVKWEDRIIEIREGPWSYVAGSTIGKAPEKVVGTAKPKEEAKDSAASWLFSMGYELTVRWEWEPESSSSIDALSFSVYCQDPDSSVSLLKGRKMQYQIREEERRLHKTEKEFEEEEEGFVTLIRYSDDNPNGKATALLNWRLLAIEVLPEEDAVFALLLCLAILRSVSEMKKEDVGGLLIRRRLKEAKSGARDWGSVIVHPSTYCPKSLNSPYVKPWYWNARAVLAHDQSCEQIVNQPVALSSAEGGDKLYKRGILT